MSDAERRLAEECGLTPEDMQQVLGALKTLNLAETLDLAAVG